MEPKSPFMIYADIESILVLENNGNQISDVFSIKKNQNHVGCIFGYKLVFFNNQFSKPLKSYFGQDTVYKFITNMIK